MITATAFRHMTKGNDHLLEERIDAAISQAAITYRPMVTIGASMLNGFSLDAINRVLQKYRANGWMAELVTDPRDGDYVSMAPR